MVYRIDDTTAVSSPPPIPSDNIGQPGFFTGGSTSGQSATRVRFWWLNMIQEELVSFASAAGLALDKSNNAQTLAAARILFAAAERGVAPYSPALARLIGGYPQYAVTVDASGAFWVSKSDKNMTVPGADGGLWKGLLDDVVSKDWANTTFQPVGDYARTDVGNTFNDDQTFNGATAVPDITKFDGKDALNAKTAEGRYVRSVPTTGGTNIRIVDIQEDSIGTLIATMSDGTTQDYIPSGQIVQGDSVQTGSVGGQQNAATADSNLTLTRKSSISAIGYGNYGTTSDRNCSIRLEYSSDGGATFNDFGTSDITNASCIVATGMLVLEPGDYVIRCYTTCGNSVAISWSTCLHYTATSV